MGWKQKLEILGAHEPRTGPGISRPRPGDCVRPFTVRVTPDRGRPMLATLPACDAEQAITFAKNRWPNAKTWRIVTGRANHG
jgi:hypothetical protein